MMRLSFCGKGRSPRTGKQGGGKENRKTAHERDRGGFQELFQTIEACSVGEVSILVRRACFDNSDSIAYDSF